MTYYLKGSRSKERMHDRYPVMKEKVKLEIEASSCDVIVLDRKGMMQGKRRQLRFTKKKMFCQRSGKGVISSCGILQNIFCTSDHTRGSAFTASRELLRPIRNCTGNELNSERKFNN